MDRRGPSPTHPASGDWGHHADHGHFSRSATPTAMDHGHGGLRADWAAALEQPSFHLQQPHLQKGLEALLQAVVSVASDLKTLHSKIDRQANGLQELRDTVRGEVQQLNTAVRNDCVPKRDWAAGRYDDQCRVDATAAAVDRLRTELTGDIASTAAAAADATKAAADAREVLAGAATAASLETQRRAQEDAVAAVRREAQAAAGRLEGLTKEGFAVLTRRCDGIDDATSDVHRAAAAAQATAAAAQTAHDALRARYEASHEHGQEAAAAAAEARAALGSRVAVLEERAGGVTTAVGQATEQVRQHCEAKVAQAQADAQIAAAASTARVQDAAENAHAALHAAEQCKAEMARQAAEWRAVTAVLEQRLAATAAVDTVAACNAAMEQHRAETMAAVRGLRAELATVDGNTKAVREVVVASKTAAAAAVPQLESVASRLEAVEARAGDVAAAVESAAALRGSVDGVLDLLSVDRDALAALERADKADAESLRRQQLSAAEVEEARAQRRVQLVRNLPWMPERIKSLGTQADFETGARPTTAPSNAPRPEPPQPRPPSPAASDDQPTPDHERTMRSASGGPRGSDSGRSLHDSRHVSPDMPSAPRGSYGDVDPSALGPPARSYSSNAMGHGHGQVQLRPRRQRALTTVSAPPREPSPAEDASPPRGMGTAPPSPAPSPDAVRTTTAPTTRISGVPRVGANVQTADLGLGTLVLSTAADGPAAVAGLTAGDIITSVAGHSAKTRDAFVAALARQQPFSRVSVHFVSGVAEGRRVHRVAELVLGPEVTFDREASSLPAPPPQP